MLGIFPRASNARPYSYPVKGTSGKLPGRACLAPTALPLWGAVGRGNPTLPPNSAL